MTQPVRDLYITPELVAKFADYYRRHEAWGVLHVSLDDGNYKSTMSDDLDWLDSHRAKQIAGTGRCDRGPVTAEERELAALHDRLTPSQRKKLGHKAEKLAGDHRAFDRWAAARPTIISDPDCPSDRVYVISGPLRVAPDGQHEPDDLRRFVGVIKIDPA
ncbi:MAG: hypothetical protein AAB262_09185 [Elusimicrobiota bacterium]